MPPMVSYRDRLLPNCHTTTQMMPKLYVYSGACQQKTPISALELYAVYQSRNRL